MVTRKMTDHWVDRLVKDTGKSINQIAKGCGISTGWFSNCKRRGTPIDGVVSRNLDILSHYLGLNTNNLIARYK